MTEQNKKNMYLRPLLTGAVICGTFLILSAILPATASNIMSNFLIQMLFATAVNVMFGYGGLVAFGQAIFFGAGAYVYTMLIAEGKMAILPAWILALVICTVLALLIGMLVLRVSALTFGLLFLGLNILFYDLAVKVPALGSGSGIAGPLRPAFLNDTKAFFYFVLIVVAICYAVMYVIMHSSFANMARGIRENEERMMFIGVNIKNVKLSLIIISSFFASVAGILYAMLNLGAYTTYLAMDVSTQGLIMCLIGGMYNFWGPSIGAVLLTVINVALSGATIYYKGILGIILIVTILFFPSGILGQNPGDRIRAKKFLKNTAGLERGKKQ